MNGQPKEVYMDINTILNDTNFQYRKDATKGGELGKDEFLRLLVTQLQNQDPVNPLDSSQFAAQLAQFNSVEQLINVNDGITELVNTQVAIGTGMTNTLAATLSGKQVRAIGNQIAIESGGTANVSFELSSPATDATITIKDLDGNVVRVEKLSNLSAGKNSWEWDGTSTLGLALPDGNYKFEVTAQDGENAVSVIPFVEGVVEKVKYGSEGVQLYVNGMYISLGDVEEIGESPQ